MLRRGTRSLGGAALAVGVFVGIACSNHRTPVPGELQPEQGAAATPDTGAAPDASTSPDAGAAPGASAAPDATATATATEDAGHAAPDVGVTADVGVADDAEAAPDAGAAPKDDAAPDAGTDASPSSPDAAPNATPDAATAPDAGADAGAPDDGGAASGPLALTEREPNDDHNTPSLLPIGATMLASSDDANDVDCFEIEAPAGDPSGGYFQATLTQVGPAEGLLSASLYTVSDNGLLYPDAGDNVGQGVSFFWAASHGQRYQIRVQVARAADASATAVPYTIKVDYQPIADPREENDNADTASPISLGTPVSAYIFHGFITTTLPADQDWYSIDLGAGPATVTLASVPGDIQMAVQIFDSNMAPVRDLKGEGLGSGGVATIMVDNPGTHRLRALAVGRASGFKGYGDGTKLPRSFLKAYTLTVSQ
jgi:hypothetical protein